MRIVLPSSPMATEVPSPGGAGADMPEAVFESKTSVHAFAWHGLPAAAGVDGGGAARLTS
jgi:hypothetical protein